MPEKFQIDFDNFSRTAVVRVFGNLDADAILNPFEVVRKKYGIKETNILWDFTKCSFSNFSLDEILKVGKKRKEYSPQRKNTKSAVLLNDDLKEILLKLFKDSNFESEPELMIFSDPDDARSYLNLGKQITLSIE